MKVSWDYDIPNIWKVINSLVPVTTNQIGIAWGDHLIRFWPWKVDQSDGDEHIMLIYIWNFRVSHGVFRAIHDSIMLANVKISAFSVIYVYNIYIYIHIYIYKTNWHRDWHNSQKQRYISHGQAVDQTLVTTTHHDTMAQMSQFPNRITKLGSQDMSRP